MGFPINTVLKNAASAARGGAKEAKNNAQDLKKGAENSKFRSVATSVGLRAVIGGSAVVGGYTGAHAISDKGDYQYNRKWMVGAAEASVVIGAGAMALLLAGRSKSLGSMDEVVQKAVTQGEKRKLVGPSPTPEQHAQLEQWDDELVHDLQSLRPKVQTGHNIAEAGVYLVAGGLAGVAVTSSRLDPGVMHWIGELTVKDESDSGLEKNAKSAGEGAKNLGGAAKDGVENIVKGLIPGI